VGGQSDSYDANGTLTARNGLSYTWDAENRPLSLSGNGVTETYPYDGDGERISKSSGGVTTIYLEGLWEETVGGAVTQYDQFNGQTVGLRRGASVLKYVHTDHLGSVSLVTNGPSGGALVSQQAFDPWGRVRSGGISQTTLNDTGPRLDGTGLVYYHARYDDPALGRFISADSVVPGAGPLTAAPHAAPAQAAWGQGGGGPANPQDLNRYAYGLNNPVKYSDPSGHIPVPLLIIGGMLLLKGIDYGWTAWDAYQAGQTLADPNASPEAKAEAATNLALTGVAELAEPDDILPVGLPIDDLARHGILGAVRDFQTRNTKQWSAWFKSEGEARALAREKLGKNPIEIGPEKWRSRDGKWQYRAKPDDVDDLHVHLEELDPETGEVLQNLHLRWPKGGSR
jgi:RHS repeat-associated protein